MVFQLPYEYVDKSVTRWGGMRLMKEFLNKTNIKQQINFLDLPKPGSTMVMIVIILVRVFLLVYF
jgi:hypothetical protein